MNQAKILSVFLVLALLAAPLRAAAQYLPAGPTWWRSSRHRLFPALPSRRPTWRKRLQSIPHERRPRKPRSRPSQNSPSLPFAPAIGPWFQLGKFPKTEALFRKVEAETKTVTDIGQDHWKRPRPYTTDQRFVHITPEKRFCYPSGHSTRATVFALVFAELFPARRDAFLGISRDIGWHRVLGGVHYPADIYAGRVLGQAIVREFIASPAFQHDLGEAKAELAAMAAQP